MKKLYFARHGQSVLNVSGHFAGHTDTPLTEEGRRQAKKAGEKAKRLSIDTIVASPLARAHDTAIIIAEAVGHDPRKIITHDLLRERYYGTAEATPYSTDRFHLEKFEEFETEEQLDKRVRQIVQLFESLQGENILIVSHGGIGRRLRKYFLPDYDYFERIPNARIDRWL